MGRIGLFFSVILWCGTALSQGRNSNWLFAEQNKIAFTWQGPQVSSSPWSHVFTVSPLSDPDGSLLLFTDWSGIFSAGGDTIFDTSQSADPTVPGQGWLLVPVPQSTSLIQAFRIDRTFPTWTLWTGVVDLSLNDGAGAMPAGMQLLMDSAVSALTAVQHSNGQDYWILTHRSGDDAYLAYLLGPTGLDTIPVVSHTGPVRPEVFNGFFNPANFGSLVATYDGTKLGCMAFPANPFSEGAVQLAVSSFNASSGTVDCWMEFTDFPGWGANGLEFSPDGSKLFASSLDYSAPSYLTLHQYDVSVQDTGVVLASHVVLDNEESSNLGGIQGNLKMALGPDGRIYMHRECDPDHLGVVQFPDSIGSAAGYQREGLAIPASACDGLPNLCKRYHDSEMSIGMDDQGQATKGLRAWPVPADDELWIAFPERGTIAIVDLTGREFISRRTDDMSSGSLDVSRLATGTYLLRFVSEHGRMMAKVFVKR
jgi:hypothetical protein